MSPTPPSTMPPSLRTSIMFSTAPGQCSVYQWTTGAVQFTCDDNADDANGPAHAIDTRGLTSPSGDGSRIDGLVHVDDADADISFHSRRVAICGCRLSTRRSSPYSTVTRIGLHVGCLTCVLSSGAHAGRLLHKHLLISSPSCLCRARLKPPLPPPLPQ